MSPLPQGSVEKRLNVIDAVACFHGIDCNLHGVCESTSIRHFCGNIQLIPLSDGGWHAIAFGHSGFGSAEVNKTRHGVVSELWGKQNVNGGGRSVRIWGGREVAPDPFDLLSFCPGPLAVSHACARTGVGMDIRTKGERGG